MRALYATVLLASLFLISEAGEDQCRCTHDKSCWPSANDFKQLESQLSQSLIYPHPSAYPCYPPSNPTPSCADVRTNWTDTNWRSSQPGSMESPNWETYTLSNGTTETCFLNTSITGTCEQGRVPPIGVDARSVNDVKLAVNFASENNLKLVIKNTGHDYLGRSAAPGAFMIWTHNMKNITYDAGFIPQGGPKDQTWTAVTLDAGVQWHEAYAAVAMYDQIIVGAVDAGGSVGTSGGWVAGGGHSFLSPTYGLGVDNALQITVVLSTGEYLVTNEYQHSDLFWALRGGGGGTYGIVTSVTYRTYPIVPFQTWTFQANVTNSSVLPELVNGYLRYQTNFTNNGWGGYGGVSSQGINFFYLSPNMTNETATATTAPWLNFVQSFKPYGVDFASDLSPATWGDLMGQFLNTVGPGGGNYELLTSRLLSRETVAENSPQVAEVLIDCNAGISTVAGGKVNQYAPDSAGLNPAWRKTVVVAECPIAWEENTSSDDINKLITQFRGWIQKLQDATPDDGTYWNSASPYEIDWQRTLFGSHYSDLESIKDKYDQNQMFVVKYGVGSEKWNPDLTCFEC